MVLISIIAIALNALISAATAWMFFGSVKSVTIDRSIFLLVVEGSLAILSIVGPSCFDVLKIMQEKLA